MTAMRMTIYAIVITCAATSVAYAQTTEIALGSQERKTVVTASTVFQRYDDTFQMSEFSVPVQVSIPAGRNLVLSGYAALGSVSGDGFESFSGMTDLHVNANYVTEVGSSSIVLGLGAAIPIGKRDLSLDEFDASVVLSQHGYDFRVPGFGQDFRMTPSIAVAVPVARDVVAGFGASYVLRGSYTPIELLSESLGPGNELAITAGLDTRLSATTFLSADLTFTTYGTDTLGDIELVQVGNKIIAVVKLYAFARHHEFTLLGIYRNQSGTRSNGAAVASGERTTPSTGEIRGLYSRKVSDRVSLNALSRLRFVESTPELRLLSGQRVSFPSLTILDFGGGAVFAVDKDVDVPVRLLARVGDIRGFQIEAGFRLRL